MAAFEGKFHIFKSQIMVQTNIVLISVVYKSFTPIITSIHSSCCYCHIILFYNSLSVLLNNNRCMHSLVYINFYVTIQGDNVVTIHVSSYFYFIHSFPLLPSLVLPALQPLRPLDGSFLFSQLFKLNT